MKKIVAGFIAFLLVFVNVGSVFDNTLKAAEDETTITSSGEQEPEVKIEEQAVSDELPRWQEPLTDEKYRAELERQEETGEYALITIPGLFIAQAGTPLSAADILAGAGLNLGVIRIGGDLDVSAVDWGTPGDYIARAAGVNALGITVAEIVITVRIIDTLPPIITGLPALSYDAGTVVTPEQFLADANINVTDNASAPVEPELDMSRINFDEAGVYTATVTARDATGNRSLPFIVTVTITGDALITLRGAFIAQAGTPLSSADIMAGAGIDLGIIQLGAGLDLSNVNWNVPGDYEATAVGLNGLGIAIAEIIVTIHVIDTLPPLILGNPTAQYDVDAVVTPEQFLADANIRVTDNSEGTIVPTVDLSGVNFGRAGIYRATVRAEDAYGNRSLPFIVTVTIGNNALITLRGAIVVEAGTILTPGDIMAGAGLNLGLIRLDGELDLSQVNWNVPGSYEATALGLNALGISVARIVVTVRVIDTIPPLITGNLVVNYDLGANVTPEQFLADANIHVTDNAEGTIVPEVDLSRVRFDRLGLYPAVVTARDARGNRSLPFVVTVRVSNGGALISLGGSLVVEAGRALTSEQLLLGAGIDLGLVKLGAELDLSPVNWGVPGDYTVTAVGLDALGIEVAEIAITIHVVDTLPPLITGRLGVSYGVGASVSPEQFLADANIRVLDNASAEVLPTVDLSRVNFAVPGIYQAIVRAQDESENNSIPYIVTVTIGDVSLITLRAPFVAEAGTILTPGDLLAGAGLDLGLIRLDGLLDTSGVDWGTPGNYEATAVGVNALGITVARIIIDVHVIDTLPPLILGDLGVSYNTGASVSPEQFLADAHIRVTDNAAAAVEPTVDLSRVNFNVPGLYPATVTARDASGNRAIPFIIAVRVSDGGALIRLNGTLPVEAGTILTPAQILAGAGLDLGLIKLGADLDLSGVDWNTPGSYIATAVGLDALGLEVAQIDITVNVLDTLPPVITGSLGVDYGVGASVTPEQFLLDANIQVRDNTGAEIVPTVDLSRVNFALPGIYQAIVRAEDAAGNNAIPFVVLVTVGDVSLITLRGAMVVEAGTILTPADILAGAGLNLGLIRLDGELDLSRVDWRTPGTYEATAVGLNALGITVARIVVDVTVIDTLPPVILGDLGVSYNVGATVTPEQFLADAHIRITDNAAGEIVPTVDLSRVNFNVPGLYPATVRAEDANGNRSLPFVVTVRVSNNGALITLRGSIIAEAGTPLTADEILLGAGLDLGLISLGADLELGGVDFGTPGDYDIVAVGVDALGIEVAEIIITVHVLDTLPPVITGLPVLSYDAGPAITEEQFLADANIRVIDNASAEIIPEVDLSRVDFGRAGVYEATVTAQDASGNRALPFIVAVTIRADILPPVITGLPALSYMRGAAPTEESFLEDAHIVVTDNSGETITPTVDLSGVNFDRLGIYRAVVHAEDSAGNQALPFNVAITVIPVPANLITAAHQDVTYEAGSSVSVEQIIADAGIEVQPAIGVHRTPSVDLSGVRFDTVGTYVVTAYATTLLGIPLANTRVNVHIEDTTRPVITGDSTVMYPVRAVVTETQFIRDAHIIVTDNATGPLETTVNLATINFNMPGVYQTTVNSRDARGNYAIPFIVTVTIADGINPTIIGKSEVTYPVGGGVSPAQFLVDADIEAADANGLPIPATANLAAVDFTQIGTYTATINAQDAGGAQAPAFAVTVNVVAVPADLITASADVTYEAGSVVDPAQFIADANINVQGMLGVAALPVVDLSTVDFNTPGTYPVVASAVNLLGEPLATATINVHIEDTTGPVITGNASVSYELGGMPTPEAFLADANIQVTDNSGALIVPVVDFSAVDWTEEGTYPVTVTATDLTGNTTTFELAVTITPDVTAPVITGEAGVSYELGMVPSPQRVLIDANIEVTDNSGLPIVPVVDLSGVNWLEEGTYTVPVTATDLAGNTTTFDLEITVTADETEPVISGEANVSYELGSLPTPEQFLADANIAISDNSGLPIVPTVDLSGVNWTQEGTYVATVTATDAAGNTASFDVEVTITPDVSVPVITVGGAPSFELGSTPSEADFLDHAQITITDNSGEIIVPVIDMSGVNWNEEGTYIVTVTATDSAGNTTTVEVPITITADATAPIITVGGAPSFELGSTPSEADFLDQAQITITDNSGEVIVPVIDLSGVNWMQEGTYTATVTATDSAGNTTTVEIPVIITPDVSVPVITVGGTPTFELGSTPTEADFLDQAQITITDNSGEIIVPVIDMSGVNWNEEGTYIVTVTATDSAGNTTTIEVPITITPDVTAPVITGNATLTYPAGSIVTPTQILADANITVSDNSITPIIPTVDLSGVDFNTPGTYTITVRAQDANGNEATPFEITVTIAPGNDTTPPVITGDTSVSFYINRPVTPEQFIEAAHIVVTDDSGLPIVPNVDLSGVNFGATGSYPVTVTATDASGNAATPFVVNVTIQPAPQLSIVIPNPNITYEVFTELTVPKVVSDGQMYVQYNSDLEMTSEVDLSAVDVTTLGSYPVVVTADDSYGNHAEATATIHIVDTTAPVIDALPRIEFALGSTLTPQEFLQSALVLVTDNYDQNLVPVVDISGIDFDTPGRYMVTVNATDSSGNMAAARNIVAEVVSLNITYSSDELTYEAGEVIDEERLILDKLIEVFTTHENPLEITPILLMVDLNARHVGVYTITIVARFEVSNTIVEITDSFDINIEDTTPPEIVFGYDPNSPPTYSMGSVVTIEDIIRDFEITITDNSDDEIVPVIDLSGLDLSAPGEYILNITAEDSQGNAAVAASLPVTVAAAETPNPNPNPGTGGGNNGGSGVVDLEAAERDLLASTGENAAFYQYIAAALLIIGGAIIIVIKRKKENKETK